MRLRQRFRLATVVLLEGVGYFSILYGGYLLYQYATGPLEGSNLFGALIAIIAGFFFLVISLWDVRAIKKDIPLKLRYWLTKPALILCTLILSAYLLILLMFQIQSAT